MYSIDGKDQIVEGSWILYQPMQNGKKVLGTSRIGQVIECHTPAIDGLRVRRYLRAADMAEGTPFACPIVPAAKEHEVFQHNLEDIHIGDYRGKCFVMHWSLRKMGYPPATLWNVSTPLFFSKRGMTIHKSLADRPIAVWNSKLQQDSTDYSVVQLKEHPKLPTAPVAYAPTRALNPEDEAMVWMLSRYFAKLGSSTVQLNLREQYLSHCRAMRISSPVLADVLFRLCTRAFGQTVQAEAHHQNGQINYSITDLASRYPRGLTKVAAAQILDYRVIKWLSENYCVDPTSVINFGCVYDEFCAANGSSTGQRLVSPASFIQDINGMRSDVFHVYLTAGKEAAANPIVGLRKISSKDSPKDCVWIKQNIPVYDPKRSGSEELMPASPAHKVEEPVAAAPARAPSSSSSSVDKGKGRAVEPITPVVSKKRVSDASERAAEAAKRRRDSGFFESIQPTPPGGKPPSVLSRVEPVSTPLAQLPTSAHRSLAPLLPAATASTSTSTSTSTSAPGSTGMCRLSTPNDKASTASLAAEAARRQSLIPGRAAPSALSRAPLTDVTQAQTNQTSSTVAGPPEARKDGAFASVSAAGRPLSFFERLETFHSKKGPLAIAPRLGAPTPAPVPAVPRASMSGSIVPAPAPAPVPANAATPGPTLAPAPTPNPSDPLPTGLNPAAYPPRHNPFPRTLFDLSLFEFLEEMMRMDGGDRAKYYAESFPKLRDELIGPDVMLELGVDGLKPFVKTGCAAKVIAVLKTEYSRIMAPHNAPVMAAQGSGR